MSGQLWILSEAAEIFGIDPRGIAALVDGLGIETKPIRANRRARGLDAADMARVAKALDKPWPASLEKVASVA